MNREVCVSNWETSSTLGAGMQTLLQALYCAAVPSSFPPKCIRHTFPCFIEILPVPVWSTYRLDSKSIPRIYSGQKFRLGLLAISLLTFWMKYRSLDPVSLGVSSGWEFEDTMLMSIDRMVSVLNRESSLRQFEFHSSLLDPLGP